MQGLFYDVLYLLACAANREKADMVKIEAMDLDALYAIGKKHHITAMIASALLPYLKENTEQYDKWFKEKMKALYREMNFSVEREKIFAFFEENGIWYMPLKGVILKDYYPEPALREFADNDILFDASCANQLKEYMTSHGYRLKEDTDSGHVDEYEKLPCYNFEMHRALYYRNNAVFYAYYKDVKSRLIKDEDNQCGYHFSDEDFYVFIISHMFKHYRDGGVGIRYLLDIYLYNKAKGGTLDYEYIEKQLKAIECDSFEKEMRLLSQNAFAQSVCSLTEKDQNMIEYCFASGTYGSMENVMKNRVKFLTGKTDFSSKNRLKYWLKRVFSLEHCKTEFPRAYKTVIAIPFLMLFRFFRGLTKLGTLKEENERLKQMEE